MKYVCIVYPMSSFARMLTGDMGRIVDGRFLKITGRIKEQFKLENGE
jgi:hypothetical protein